MNAAPVGCCVHITGACSVGSGLGNIVVATGIVRFVFSAVIITLSDSGNVVAALAVVVIVVVAVLGCSVGAIVTGCGAGAAGDVGAGDSNIGCNRSTMLKI